VNGGMAERSSDSGVRALDEDGDDLEDVLDDIFDDI
jgi:hypothetical protein